MAFIRLALTDTIKLFSLSVQVLRSCFSLPAMFALFARLSSQATAKRAQVSRHPGVKASRPRACQHAKTRSGSQLNWLRRAAHCSVLSPVSSPFYLRTDLRLNFSLKTTSSSSLSPLSSPCSSSLLTLSGDGAVYDFIFLILYANLLSSNPYTICSFSAPLNWLA